MCGRFTQFYTWAEIHRMYNLTSPASNVEPRYNIAPTDIIDTVVSTPAGMQLERARWGLVPYWWEKPLKEVPATFNARAETVAEKPMFRSAFKTNRCLIPASGFFEWKTIHGKKQPFHITAVDGSLLSIAGLWDTWKDPAIGERLRSCTMIVTDANQFMKAIHNRMPVLLQPHQFVPWLSGEAGADILRPAAEDYLTATAVSPKVNYVKNQGPELVEPVGP